MIALHLERAVHLLAAVPARITGLLESDILQALPLYVLMGALLNRLPLADIVFRAATRAFARSRAAPLLAALLFSAAHAPNWFLMLVTFVGGYVSATVYLDSRNLYFLGLAHGLFGFLLYLVVPDTISHHLYVGPKWFS